MFGNKATIGAAAFVIAGLALGSGAAQEEKGKAEAKAPPTVKAQAGPFVAKATIKGVVESKTMTEVSIDLKGWSSPLTVLKAAKHGQAVKSGEFLASFDPNKIDQAIVDAELELALATLALKSAKAELPVVLELAKLELAAAQRAAEFASQDLKKFTSLDKPLAVESADFGVKSSEHYLEYAAEELKQLQKMYRDKDLTEETEEMILKRQRHQVESAEFSLKRQRIARDQSLNVELPRREQSMNEARAKAQFALVKAKELAPIEERQKATAIAKLELDHAKLVRKLDELKGDRKGFEVKSPADGVVYYGACVDGEWPEVAATAAKLRKGGSATPNDVLMTIVTGDDLFVRAKVEEKELGAIKPGLGGTLALAAYPDAKAAGTIESVGLAPKASGSFEAIVAAKFPPGTLPGMAATVEVVTYKNDNAVLVPSSAIVKEGEQSFVKLPGGEKRAVGVGKSGDGKTEIVEGLKAGEEVLGGP